MDSVFSVVARWRSSGSPKANQINNVGAAFHRLLFLSQGEGAGGYT